MHGVATGRSLVPGGLVAFLLLVLAPAIAYARDGYPVVPGIRAAANFPMKR